MPSGSRPISVDSCRALLRAWGLGLAVLVALSVSSPVLRAETLLIGVAGVNGDGSLVQFDSAAPDVMMRSIVVTGELDSFFPQEMSFEFDPVSRQIVALAYWGCQTLCPGEWPTALPFRIDPFTGIASFEPWSEFPGLVAGASALDLREADRELRFFGADRRNLRFSLADFHLVEDSALALDEGYLEEVAHRDVTSLGGGIETFAIHVGATGRTLVRIGGPGGVPPASSGQVTTIGPLAVTGAIRGFDISPSGNAFMITQHDFTEPIRLLRIELATAAVTELGTVAVPGIPWWAAGLTIVPDGFGPGAVEIPAASRFGLVALGISVALAAVFGLRGFRRVSH